MNAEMFRYNILKSLAFNWRSSVWIIRSVMFSILSIVWGEINRASSSFLMFSHVFSTFSIDGIKESTSGLLFFVAKTAFATTSDAIRRFLKCIGRRNKRLVFKPSIAVRTFWTLHSVQHVTPNPTTLAQAAAHGTTLFRQRMVFRIVSTESKNALWPVKNFNSQRLLAASCFFELHVQCQSADFVRQNVETRGGPGFQRVFSFDHRFVNFRSAFHVVALDGEQFL